VKLPLTIQHQCVSFWCWAAVATTVHNFLNRENKTRQCALARVHLNGKCCDARDAQALPCNDAPYITTVLRGLGNLSGGLISPPRRTSTPTRRQLDRSRPVVVDIQWHGTTELHSILVTGYKSDAYGQFFYHVEDPLHSPKRKTHCPGGVQAPGAGCQPRDWILMDELMNAYQYQGSWLDTMYTKSATRATAPR
jgi:hypothetical protein